MSRYRNMIQTPNRAELYNKAISQYMFNEGFTLVDYEGIKVWKKGMGWIMGSQYLSI